MGRNHIPKGYGIFTFSLIVAVIFLAATFIYTEENQNVPNRLESIQKGEKCIQNKFPNYNFLNDPYIYCGGSEKCQFYRVLDIGIILNWFNSSVLNDYQETARSHMEFASKDFESREINFHYLEPESKDEEDKIALDSYCMTGLFTNSQKIAERVYNDFKSGKNLSGVAKTFRRIVDETWCIALMSEFHHNDSFIASLAVEKDMQMKEFVAVNESSSAAYMPIHFLIMNHHLKRNGYNELENEEGFYIEKMEEIAAKNKLSGNDLCNILFVSKRYAGLKNNFTKGMFMQILKNQQQDGCWRDERKGEAVTAFPTLHCILALSESGDEELS